MDHFGPARKGSKNLIHLLGWTTFPGRTGWNFGWMDRAPLFPVWLVWNRAYSLWSIHDVTIITVKEQLEQVWKTWRQDESVHGSRRRFLEIFSAQSLPNGLRLNSNESKNTIRFKVRYGFPGTNNRCHDFQLVLSSNFGFNPSIHTWFCIQNCERPWP